MIRPFRVGGYRSFGEQCIEIPEINKINLFAGANNSGKSNILKFVSERYGPIVTGIHRKGGAAKLDFSDLDRHIGSSAPLTFALGLEIGGEYHQALEHRVQQKGGPVRNRLNLLGQLFRSLSEDGETAWFTYESPAPDQIPQLVETEALINSIRKKDWQEVWIGLTEKNGGGNFESNWFPEAMGTIRPKFAAPDVHLIEAFRTIGPAGAPAEGYSGIGLIERLAQLQNPPRSRQEDKVRFQNINEFLQTVIDDDSASIEIPYERKTVLVHQQGRVLPLSNLGTGIHQVVILAAAATVLEGVVICMEEPELHLHPILQRKLVSYLDEKTDNQYFITTHSAHLLDTPNASVYHVYHDGESTNVTQAISSNDKHEICRSLGYLASDLLQANAVIWVEGPSDRIYLKHWLSTQAPDLVEGMHYSIMFYGGRLLSHLTADDEEVTDFIALRKLNRNVVLLIDSDLKSSSGELNDTKTRVAEEITKHGGVAWVTAGRTIENYVPFRLISSAIQSVHSSTHSVPRFNRFQSPTRRKLANGRISKDVDKVKVARAVAAGPADLGVDSKLVEIG